MLNMIDCGWFQSAKGLPVTNDLSICSLTRSSRGPGIICAQSNPNADGKLLVLAIPDVFQWGLEKCVTPKCVQDGSGRPGAVR